MVDTPPPGRPRSDEGEPRDPAVPPPADGPVDTPDPRLHPKVGGAPLPGVPAPGAAISGDLADEVEPTPVDPPGAKARLHEPPVTPPIGAGLPPQEDGLIEEVSNLFDDGVTYARAEAAFQKTRAKLAGKGIGVAAGALAVALILLHIALLALAVGLVIALAPLVTIWGAIAIVVGAILIGAALLAMKARSKVNQVQSLFSSAERQQ